MIVSGRLNNADRSTTLRQQHASIDREARRQRRKGMEKAKDLTGCNGGMKSAYNCCGVDHLAGILGERRRPGVFAAASSGCGEGHPPHREMVCAEKNQIIHLNWRILVNSEKYFSSRPRQKNVEFFA